MKTYKNSRGSALITVMILTGAAFLMAGALVAYTITERKLNRHMLVRLQAQDAAQATVEYGAAQINALLSTSSNIPTDYFSSHALTLYSTRGTASSGFFSTENVANDPYNFVKNTTTSLWISKITPLASIVLNPDDPRNINEPLIGYTDSVQAVTLLASATATDGLGNSATSYATETIAMRFSALFAWAIFYNVTMEFHPSAQVDVFGPVFSNADVYLTQSGGPLTYHDSFQTAGSFYATTQYPSANGNGRPTGRNINFGNGLTPSSDSNAANAVSPAPAGDTSEDFYNISDPTIIYQSNPAAALGANLWLDSTFNVASGNSVTSSSKPYYQDTFQSLADSLWNKKVEAGVAARELPGVTNTDPTSGRVIIEPPDPSQSGTVNEGSKISNSAGVYIVVEPNHDGTSGADGTTPNGAVVVAFYNPTDAINYEYSDTTGLIKRSAASRASYITSHPDKILWTSAGEGTVGGDVNSLSGIVNTSRLMYDHREGKPINAVDIDVGQLVKAIGVNKTVGGSTGVTIAATQPLQVGAGSGSYTAWDVANTANSTTNKGWNGIVYVDVQTDAATSNPNNGTALPSGWQTTSDIPGYNSSSTHPMIAGTGQETAVRIVDAAQLPSAGPENQWGMSVVTNAPVYLVGTYNGNEQGTSSSPLAGGDTPNKSQIMSPDANEVPSMIVGDSINLLSNNYWTPAGQSVTINGQSYTFANGAPTGDSVLTNYDGSWSTHMAAAADTEYAAAFVSGNVPTTNSAASHTLSDGSKSTYYYSGGVENYMRYNEDWGSANVRYRGSIVSYFTSGVATGYWDNAKYGVPKNRQWAYDNMFAGPSGPSGGPYADGSHYPPGSPNVGNMQIVNFADLSQTAGAAMQGDSTTYGWTHM
jgi:hypothetical protein